jgi:energy-coupling factor transporter transmembrane protein EcfT
MRPTGKRRRSFLRRALSGLSAVSHELISQPAAKAEWIRRIDPRAVVVGTLVLVTITAFLCSPLALLSALCIGFTLAIAALRLPANRVLPIAAGAALFAVSLSFAAIFRAVSPGAPLLGGILSDAGVLALLRLTLRAAACATFAYLLAGSVCIDRIVEALGRLGLPKAFGLTISMTVRFIALIVDVAIDMHFSRMSRPAKISRDGSADRRWTGNSLGVLFLKTRALAAETQRAMISRGYTGDLRRGASRPFYAPDILIMTVCIGIAIGLKLIDR